MDSSDESSNSSSQSARKRGTKDRNGKNKSAKAKGENSKILDDKIEQLCSITGNSDKTVARNLLEACNGNLEMAINMALENAGPSGTPSNSAANEEEFVRAPIPQKQEVLVESHEGYGFGFRGKRRVVKSVFDSFRNFEAETKLQEARLKNQNGDLLLNNAEKAKKKTLEDLFRPPIDIMFKGNLQMARDAATSNKKWVMVNIQNVSEFACQVLNRDVWSHPAIKDLVREHFIFVQLYADSEEGERYTMFYKVNQWPYIGILDPRTGECLCTWNNVDHVTCADLISEFLLTNSMEDTSNEPESKRRRQEKTLLDETEEAQLEAAIKASLTETKQAIVVEEDSELSEEELESFESESESVADNEEKIPETSKDENDWKEHLGPDSDPKSTVVFRFPDGRKEQVTFPCSSSILCLLKYVSSHGFPSERFELVANFPRRQISYMEAKTTLKEAGLFPQDTVFVQSR